VRASRWDEEAAPLGEPARLEHDATGEVDPEVILERVAHVLDEVDHDGVEAVATTTLWHSLIGLDEHGKALTPLYSWADSRSAPWAARLRERLDERAVHARTGARLHSSYWPAKLAWLRETEPDTFARVRTWVSPGEYVQRRLLGDAACSVSMASGTGMLDLRACEWDGELAAELDVQERLPPIADEPRSGLASEFAERWPALRDVPWLPAWGDGATSNVGAGATGPDRAALMIGTSGALRLLDRADPPEPAPSLWCYRADAERILLGGSLSDGGSVVAWLRRLTRLPEPADAERAIAGMAPDAHGLTVLPLLSGERGPGWSDRAGAAIEGLTAHTTPIELLRAGLEAVALRFALIDRDLAGDHTIVGTGGGIVKSPAWTQIIADALGRPVVHSGVQEGSSRGAAVLALEALGKHPGEAPTGETYEPDPDATEAYAAALERQQALYERTITSTPAPRPPVDPTTGR
jgi:gluconokinase